MAAVIHLIHKIMDRKTFNNIYSRWIEEKRFTVKQSSFATYHVFAEKHILPFFGNAEAVDMQLVHDFVSLKMASGMSKSTVRSLLRLLNMIIGYGRRQGLTDCIGWKVRLRDDTARKEPGVLTVDEQRRMMAFLRQNLSFRNIGLYICLCTGIRIGEICALKWSDISLEARSLRINRTLQRIYRSTAREQCSQLHTSCPKSRCSIREIPLSVDLVRMLKPVASISDRDNFVLTNSKRPLEPHQYRRYYHSLMKRAGLPKLKFHSLRHTFATRCIESGCDYKTVSALLGHASVATTMNLYVHPCLEQKRRCVNRMLRFVR